jgi:hypothetical protein
MTDDLMRMASFRIDRDLWAKFGAIAKRERLTVTDVLTDYIQRCTDNDKTEYAVNTGNDDAVNTSNYNNDAVMTMVNTAIDNRVLPLIKPHAERLVELEAYTQSQFASVRAELKKLTERVVLPTNDALAQIQSINQLGADTSAEIQSINRSTDVDPNRASLAVRKTWGQFFEMVGMESLPAKDAQRKENIILRDKQVEEGILKAKEMGLGVWTDPRPGREFVRCDDAPNS